MRIVGGIFKAKNLKEFSNPAIRPTADKTRESLFDILGERISGAKFLDLFAGTGGVGIEAISRGAKKVTFVDADKSCLDLVKQNIKTVGAESADHELKLSDGLKFLSETNEKFDYIFIDPPYKTDLGQKALKIIFERTRKRNRRGGVRNGVRFEFSLCVSLRRKDLRQSKTRVLHL